MEVDTLKAETNLQVTCIFYSGPQSLDSFNAELSSEFFLKKN